MLCVQDNQGRWCVAYPQKPRDPDKIRTLCGFYVHLPFGLAEREPTCCLCQKRLKRIRRRIKRAASTK